MKKETIKPGRIVGIVLSSLIVIAFIVLLVLHGVLTPAEGSQGTAFYQWIDTELVNYEHVFTPWYHPVIHSLIYIALVWAGGYLVRVLLKLFYKSGNRTKTVVTLLDGFIKYGCAIAILILVMTALIENIAAIITVSAVLTLVIGLGAQSLIADIIAGIFIVFDNEFIVGEIITIDDFRGTVTDIGVRTTKLVDAAGNIKIVNNSDIKNVVNLSRELSLAVVDCEFPYDVKIEQVEKFLIDDFENMRKTIPGIVEGPFYKGVAYYADSNVAVKLVAKCKEEDRFQVQRDIMREYRQVLLAHGIDLSFQQVVISNSTPTAVKENPDEQPNRVIAAQEKEQEPAEPVLKAEEVASSAEETAVAETGNVTETQE